MGVEAAARSRSSGCQTGSSFHPPVVLDCCSPIHDPRPETPERGPRTETRSAAHRPSRWRWPSLGGGGRRGDGDDPEEQAERGGWRGSRLRRARGRETERSGSPAKWQRPWQLHAQRHAALGWGFGREFGVGASGFGFGLVESSHPIQSTSQRGMRQARQSQRQRIQSTPSTPRTQKTQLPEPEGIVPGR